MLDPKPFKPRRWFLGGAAATAAALGFGKVASSADAVPPGATGGTDFQKWLDRIRGQYRQVYDMALRAMGSAKASSAWSWCSGTTRFRSR